MNIFLDDERHPSFVGMTTADTICRNFDEFKKALDLSIANGDLIEFISFDHDLGRGKNGLDCAKELSEYDMDHSILSENFDYIVHSMNPVGRINIIQFMENYLKVKANV